MSLKLLAQIYLDDEEDELVSEVEVEENCTNAAEIKVEIIQSEKKVFENLDKSSSANADNHASDAISPSIKNDLVASTPALPRSTRSVQLGESSVSKEDVDEDVKVKEEDTEDDADFYQVVSKCIQVHPKYKCPYCYQPFIQACGLTDHLIVHTGKRWRPPQTKPSQGTKIITPTSKISTISEPKAGIILNRKTKRKPKFKCDKCEYAFNSKQNLDIHMKQHTEKERPFKCSGCTCAFWSNKSLGIHEARIHKDLAITRRMMKSAFLKCSKCNYSSKQQVNFDVHMRRHSANAGKFKCHECNCYFRNLHALIIHRRRTHKTDIISKLPEIKVVKQEQKSSKPTVVLKRVKVFPCSKCRRYFATAVALKLHEFSSHQVTTSWRPRSFIKFQCDKCSFSSNKYSNYQAHISTAHENNHIKAEPQDNIVKVDTIKPGTESPLPENAPFKIIERKGKSAKLYKCTTCQKVFKGLSRINEHLISHTDAKLFQCSYCTTKFKFERNLTQHIRSYHNVNGIQAQIKSLAKNQIKAEAQHKIVQARSDYDKDGTTSSSGHTPFEITERTDKSGKLYKCNTCQKPCKRLSDMNIHLISHTSEKLHKCTHCNTAFKYIKNLHKHIKIKHKNLRLNYEETRKKSNSKIN